ncbi:hypothetical protein BJV77DRAFT_962777 [Russula vinacea]|nr:hypothetical protein BJV77DRAFT_962777 [Russula vinacea]
MHFSTALRLATVLLAPLVVSAAPLKRGTDPATLQVLDFAFVLESLETQFYQQGLNKFKSSDFSSAGFSSGDIAIEEITIIQSDESRMSRHRGNPHCIRRETTFRLLVRLLERARGCLDYGVGRTTRRKRRRWRVPWCCAPHPRPAHLDCRRFHVTIESRHQTMLNLFEGASAISQPFDIPLLPQEVLAIAGSFIKGCDLGIPANPSLSVTNTGSVTTGTSLQFSSPALNSSTSGFHCQMLTGGMPFSLSLPLSQCVVPKGINGPVAIWITSDDQPVNGQAVDRQSNAIVAGPEIVFIDIVIDDLSKMVRPSKSGSSSGSSSNSSSYPSSGSSYPTDQASSLSSATTVVVVPSQASAILSSLSAASTSAPPLRHPPPLPRWCRCQWYLDGTSADTICVRAVPRVIWVVARLGDVGCVCVYMDSSNIVDS